ncbi:MAG: ATP-binding protein [Bacteroidales bacterium]|nr:ATP-binding protein [Bacteroidales bacterium]
MLKRKVIQQLSQWKKTAGKKPLIIKGCRQCGKTFAVRKFADDNYKNVIYLNFIENPDLSIAFEGQMNVDDIILNLSSMIKGVIFEPQQTCIIFDEIQDCPKARTALKFFHLDGRFDVIATGALLGVKGYGDKNGQKASVPVGYETIINMFPLDFEEFLWANGISEQIISKLQECLDNVVPVPEAIHQRMKKLLLQYVVTGGMPEAVNALVNTHDLNQVLNIQRTIISEYEDDMIKYADSSIKPRIRECFESIPRQLSKENKKFQYSLIRKNAKASHYENSLQWIEDAGIICRCRNLEITELPLDGNVENDVFKIYMADTGLFVSMLEDGTQSDILQGNLLGYKGAVFENLIADIFCKMQRKLYYFRKDSGLEVDFVMRYKGECTLVEVKAVSGNTKSTKTILSHYEKYHVKSAIKLGDYNIGFKDNILTLPHYLAFLLREY